VDKFLVDESSGAKVAQLLRAAGYDVLAVVEEMKGTTDEVVLSRALGEDRIIVTNDKELASLAISYRAAGVLLLRLRDERTEPKLRVVRRVLERYSSRMHGSMIVASEKRIRIRPL
jgi:predicted nuclease of predicted toxin-antitoxin system